VDIVKTKLKYMKNITSIPTNIHGTKPYISLRKFLVLKGIKTALKMYPLIFTPGGLAVLVSFFTHIYTFYPCRFLKKLTTSI
jgi:hypothetical protein